MVFFFDLSSMQPEDIDRAVQSATDFVNKQMQPADLVALVSLDTGLTMDQDFTANKPAILKALAKYNGTDSSGIAAGGTSGSTDATADDGSSFAADDSEYAALNTDKELYAIQQIAKSLERVDSRKSMLYFSGGLTRQGIENQASMRAATNAAVKANMAIYSVDTRGLEGPAPRRQRLHRLPPRHRRLLWRLHAVQSAEQLQLPGSPRHPRLRHRRQVLLRLKRLRPRLPANPA